MKIWFHTLEKKTVQPSRKVLFIMRTMPLFVLATLLGLGAPSWAWYPRDARDSYFPEKNPAPIIGHNRYTNIDPESTLIDLAYEAGLGYDSLANANPDVDPWMPSKNQDILLPYATIFPWKAKPGILINIAECRLYYLWREGKDLKIRIYPIGIGQEGWESPSGTFFVANKARNPTWVAPASIRRERPDEPAVIPPGPDNPLGGYWMGLSIKGYGIHGTHKPLGVGRQVSHGCIRLYPNDISDLFPRVAVKTPVTMVYQPVKVGLRDNNLWAEIHPDNRNTGINVKDEISRQSSLLGWKNVINWKRVQDEANLCSGVPFVISSGDSSPQTNEEPQAPPAPQQEKPYYEELY